MLFYTGITRSANVILAEQNSNVETTRPLLDQLRDLASLPPDGYSAATPRQLTRPFWKAGKPNANSPQVFPPPKSIWHAREQSTVALPE